MPGQSSTDLPRASGSEASALKNPQKMGSIRPPLLGFRLCAFLASVAFSGCATVRVSRPDHWAVATNPPKRWEAPNDAFTVADAATFPIKETVYVKWWGLSQRNIDPGEGANFGLAEVKVSTNLGFALVSLCTLGILQPITIEWRSMKQPQPSGGDFNSVRHE